MIARVLFLFQEPVHTCDPEPRFVIEYFPGWPKDRKRWFKTLPEAQAFGEECYRCGVVPELTDNETGIRYTYWTPRDGLSGEVKESLGRKYVPGHL